MHKKHNILFVLLFMHLSAFAQVYFNKSYSPYLPYTATQYIPVGIVNVCETNIGYLTSGSYPTMDKRVLYIVVTDILGDTICTKIYGETGEVYYSGYGGGMFATTDGNYAISGTYKKDSLDADGLLVKLNSLGDTLWTKKYGSPTEETFYCGTMGIDGNYYLAGTAYDTIGQHYDMYVVKADSMGNAIWEKKYGGAGSQSASNIQITMDGNILISGYSGSGNNYNALAIKLDTAGNVLWTHSINTNGGGGGKTIETSDGGYLHFGTYQISTLPNYCQYFVQKLNNSKQVQWELKFADAVNRLQNYNSCVEINGFYILTGGYRDTGGTKYYGIISKINAAGQRIWHRDISKFEKDNYTSSIRGVSDGGFIIAGFGSEFLPNGMYSQEAWLCKVDSFGCLQQGCELFDAIDETSPTVQEELIVFPNPVKHQLFIESKTNIQIIRIYNLLGELVLSENEINTSDKHINVETLKPGIYILQIENQTGSIQQKFVKE